LRCIPIEILHGVRACGRAISATDATIINLGDKALFVFISRIDGAHLGTGGMIAMHAWSGKKSRLNVRIFPLDIRDQFDPVDGAAFC
jgi:hypothetical protein